MSEKKQTGQQKAKPRKSRKRPPQIKLALHGDLVNLPDEVKQEMLRQASEARRGYWSRFAKQCEAIEAMSQEPEPAPVMDEEERAKLRQFIDLWND